MLFCFRRKQSPLIVGRTQTNGNKPTGQPNYKQRNKQTNEQINETTRIIATNNHMQMQNAQCCSN